MPQPDLEIKMATSFGQNKARGEKRAVVTAYLKLNSDEFLR